MLCIWVLWVCGYSFGAKLVDAASFVLCMEAASSCCSCCCSFCCCGRRRGGCRGGGEDCKPLYLFWILSNLSGKKFNLNCMSHCNFVRLHSTLILAVLRSFQGPKTTEDVKAKDETCQQAAWALLIIALVTFKLSSFDLSTLVLKGFAFTIAWNQGWCWLATPRKMLYFVRSCGIWLNCVHGLKGHLRENPSATVRFDIAYLADEMFFIFLHSSPHWLLSCPGVPHQH